MNRDFSAPILDLDNEPVRAGISTEGVLRAVNSVWSELPEGTRDKLTEAMEKEAGKPLTLRNACVAALMGVYEGEQNLSDDERLARYELARKLHKAEGVLEITPQERDRIKPLLRKRYSGSVLIPVVAAQLLEQDVS